MKAPPLRTFLAAGVFACASYAPSAAATEPARWVTIDGVMTEIVFALGLGDRVVATDTSSTYPAAVDSLPKVGYVRAIHPEGVLSLRPDRILTTTTLGPPNALQQLESTEVPLTVVPRPEDPESLYNAIRVVGAVGKRENEAETLIARLETEFAAVQRLIAAAPDELDGSFLLVHGGGARAAGNRTLAQSLLDNLGIENIFAASTGYVDASMEALVARQPDVILIGTTRDDFPEGNDALRRTVDPRGVLSASEIRIVPVDLSRALSFGPRFAETALDLAESIHQTEVGASPAR